MSTKKIKCPYCGHNVSQKEYQQLIKKVEREVTARVQREVSEERMAIQKERRDLARARKEAKREARELVKKQVSAKTKTLQTKLGKLQVRVKTAQQEGKLSGRRERQREIDRAQVQISKLQRQLDRRASDELGEVSHDALLRDLKRAFPEDEITRIGKGKKGTDVVHAVRYRGKSCGSFVYECKNVAQWRDSYVSQVKKDGEAAKADYSILVTNAFPKGKQSFAMVKDVLIVAPVGAVTLARLLRSSLVEMERRGLTEKQKAEKTREIYRYLQGRQFRSSMKAIEDAASDLRRLQDDEKTAHERTWKRRDQYTDMIANQSRSISSAIDTLLESAPVSGHRRARVAASS